MLREKSSPIRYGLLLALLAFAVRAVVTTVYVQAYDRYQDAPSMTDGPSGPVHAMIKGDAGKYHALAAMIVSQVRTGENPFLAGSRHSGPFLYQRIIAAYTLVTGRTTEAADGRVVLGQVGGFLVLQSLLFSLCLIPFVVELEKVAGRAVAIGAGAFLALEPTLVQYSAFMFTEELFVGIMVLTVAAWLRVCRNETRSGVGETTTLLVLGFLLGLAFLQRPQAILLPAVFVAGLFARSQWRPKGAFLKASALVLLPYVLVLSLVAAHNYARAGFAFVVPTQAPMGWQKYLANKVVAGVDGTDPDFERNRLAALALQKAKDRGLVPEHVIRGEDATEYEVMQIYRIYQEQAFEIFAEHPLRTLRVATVEIAGALVVNLPAPYRFYSDIHKPASEELDRAQQARRQAQKPFTIIYSLWILVPAALGWLLLRGTLPGPVNVVLVLSVVYFAGTGGWLGNPRYTLPNLSCYAVYWSAFVVYLARPQAIPSGAPDSSTA